MSHKIFSGGGVYLIVLVLLLLYVDSTQKVDRYREQAGTLEATICDMNQKITRTKLRFNDSVEVYQAEVKSLGVTARNLQVKYDRLLKASKTKAKDVGSVTEMSSVIAEKDTVLAYVDTFGGIKAELSDPFVNIDVEVLPDRKTIIDYKVKDSLTVVSVQKKHSWLFGLIKWKEHKEVRVINHNPKASVMGLQSIEVIE